VHNRLLSIEKDAQFVQQLASRLRLPLIANERCGSWYISPEQKTASAYFKSTDGHFDKWAFSKRRLNLHVLHIVGKYKGYWIICFDILPEDEAH
jgi:tRNA A64-2'-O-ribosylphosphate transferase